MTFDPPDLSSSRARGCAADGCDRSAVVAADLCRWHLVDVLRAEGRTFAAGRPESAALEATAIHVLRVAMSGLPVWGNGRALRTEMDLYVILQPADEWGIAQVVLDVLDAHFAREFGGMARSSPMRLGSRILLRTRVVGLGTADEVGARLAFAMEATIREALSPRVQVTIAVEPPADGQPAFDPVVSFLPGGHTRADGLMVHIDPERFDEFGFSSELYSEVVPGLFQAGAVLSPLQLFAHGFDVVFDLCGRDRGDGLTDQTYVPHPIDDVPWITEPEEIHRLGEQVADLVRSGKKVVVNCMSGLNRSGLLVARALIELGHAPLDAVDLVRRARGPHALSNRQFMRFLVIDCTPRALSERRSASDPSR